MSYTPVDPKAAVLAFNEGIAAMGSGKQEEAVAKWRKALELDPALIPAALNLVTFFQDQEDLKAELELWERIVAYDPFETDHLVLQASALRKAKRHDQAVENYKRAIAIYPYFKFWYHELAAVLREMNNIAEADQWEARGDALGADVAEICYEDGVRHAKDERWDSAKVCFEAVLEEFPGNIDARLRLARVLESAGSDEGDVTSAYDDAVEHTDAAKALVSYRKGEYFLRMGSRDAAKAAFKAALDAVPTFLRAARVVYMLEGQEKAKQGDAEAPPAGVEELVYSSAPMLRPPNPMQSWDQQLRFVLEQVLANPAPGAREPRVALIVEADPELANVFSYTIAALQTRESGLSATPQKSNIFVVEAYGSNVNALDSGWLGQQDSPPLDTRQWGQRRPGVPLDSALRAISQQSQQAGFNCVLILGFGRCFHNPGTSRTLLSAVRTHSVCFLHPVYHYVDLRTTLAPQASNYVEIMVH